MSWFPASIGLPVTLRSKEPNRRFSVVPKASRGALVIRFTTPLIAFAPQMAEAGPLTTSIRCRSSSPTDRKSQLVKPKKS